MTDPKPGRDTPKSRRQREDAIDKAVADTFPASDPTAFQNPAGEEPPDHPDRAQPDKPKGKRD